MKYFVGALIIALLLVANRTVAIRQIEYLALYDLFNSTDGANWRWPQHHPQQGIPWDFSALKDPCSDNWQGVKCIAVNASLLNTSHVSSLELVGMNLQGSLPDSIGNFPSLQYLLFSRNLLTGTIPSSTFNLFSLKFMDFYQNQLVGTIPDAVDKLTNLLFLDFDSNFLTGTVPNAIGNLTKLVRLELSGNLFNGSISSSLGNLSHLLQLYLTDNQLTGTIPSSLGRLSSLLFLDIGANRISGTIPDSINNLHNLQLLALYKNLLSGTLPNFGVGNSTNLQQLDLYDNYLTGPLPSSIGKAKYLQQLVFYGNHLTGSIPASVRNLTNLQKMFLDSNVLTGTIPSLAENLTELSLSANQLTGSMPVFANFRPGSRLQNLDLSNNRLSGRLRDFYGMVTLATFFVQKNQFTGPITGVFSTAQTRLQTIRLDDNQFTGTLPAVLFDLPSLVSFSMVGSCLHGNLPGNICNATQLEALILYGLTTGASCRTRRVSRLQSHQSFGGTMPSCLLKLPRMTTLLLSSNGLTGSIASDIVLGLKLLQLDLSHNDLTGSIPNSLQSHSWALFDLSHNKLSGVLQKNLLMTANRNVSTNFTISPSMSLMSNRLSGPVPSSLRPLQSNLSVLAGNLFECKYDKSNLPQHDSDISNYQCASNDFNAAIYAWLCISVFVLFLVVYMYKTEMLELLNSQVLLPIDQSDKFTHLHSLLEEYHVLSKAAWCCATFCLVVLLPYYAIVSHYEGTHTYQYAYVLSAIYTSGVLPFVLDVLLLGLLVLLVYVAYFIQLPAAAAAASATSGTQDPAAPLGWQRAYVWIIFTLANITVVLGANVAFVYVVLYQSSQVQTLVQILLSLFKLGWSMVASPYMIRQLDAYFLPQTEGPPEPFFTLQLLVSLFNNIAIPCLVVAAIDPNCFSNILLPPDSQTVTYLLFTCRSFVLIFDSCIRTTPELVTLQFTPPFTYSYQCRTSFITSYAPTFIYLSISTVFLSPLLQFVLMRLHERLPTGSISHRMVSKLLPRVLKLPQINNARLLSAEQRKAPLLGSVGTLVTLLTQLGILLTFGAIFPPVALAMAVSITAVIVMTRCKVQRFVHAVVEKQLFPYLDIINAECERVGTREQMQVAAKILICYCCAFYTLFLFDTLGDAVGFEASVWVLVVFPLLPVAVFGGADVHRRLAIKDWRVKHIFNDKESGNISGDPACLELRASVTEGENGIIGGAVNILHTNIA